MSGAGDGGDREAGGGDRKDRLIQARVPERLESTLKAEARRRRTSVSHIIRDVLQDAFDLVDDVVADVDRLVTDSVELAQQVGRDARRIGAAARRDADAVRAGPADAGEPDGPRPADADEPDGPRPADADEPDGPRPADAPCREPLPEARARLAAVPAWHEVVLNRPAPCARCGATLPRGARALLASPDAPDAPRVWICRTAAPSLAGDSD